jgi:DNA gyrase subunit A
VVGLAQVKQTDEIMLVTTGGMLIRMKVKDISVIGRNTQGVRLISLENESEKVAGISRLPESESEEGDPPATPPAEGAPPAPDAPPSAPPPPTEPAPS